MRTYAYVFLAVATYAFSAPVPDCKDPGVMVTLEKAEEDSLKTRVDLTQAVMGDEAIQEAAKRVEKNEKEAFVAKLKKVFDVDDQTAERILSSSGFTLSLVGGTWTLHLLKQHQILPKLETLMIPLKYSLEASPRILAAEVPVRAVVAAGLLAGGVATGVFGTGADDKATDLVSGAVLVSMGVFAALTFPEVPMKARVGTYGQYGLASSFLGSGLYSLSVLAGEEEKNEVDRGKRLQSFAETGRGTSFPPQLRPLSTALEWTPKQERDFIDGLRNVAQVQKSGNASSHGPSKRGGRTPAPEGLDVLTKHGLASDSQLAALRELKKQEEVFEELRKYMASHKLLPQENEEDQAKPCSEERARIQGHIEYFDRAGAVVQMLVDDPELKNQPSSRSKLEKILEQIQQASSKLGGIKAVNEKKPS